MARKSTQIVSLKTRMRESLRRQIQRAAKARGGSLNGEIVRRLEESFDRDAQKERDIVFAREFSKMLDERVDEQLKLQTKRRKS